LFQKLICLGQFIKGNYDEKEGFLMKIALVLGSIVAPIIMIALYKKKIFRVIFNVVAIVSALIFGNIASLSIHQIIVDDAVFMTTIHGIFLDPFFLISGAYLGVYLLYRLLVIAMNEK